VNHYEANRILDRVREGQQFSQFVITKALELTGDYETHRGNRVDQTLPQEAIGGGQGRSPILVATNPSGHCQEARPSGC
jgi:hypothetical protein